MPTRLYLDSARMGLLSERARLAHLDFVRLAATEGCSLYFSRLLQRGFHDWPVTMRREYPALRDWCGIGELQDSLRRLVGATAQCDVMLANRTAQLVKLAARRICENTERILLPDLMWPSYRRILEFERHTQRVGISTVPIRRGVRRGSLSVEAIIDRFAQEYECMLCDSLFVPVVSHDGLRLPVDKICRRLNQIRPLRFVVVDAAQAFAHVPDELGLQHCDILLTGCHKWLQGHVPMGVAYLPNARSEKKIWSVATHMLRHSELDDPLLAFTHELLTGRVQKFSETVNLTSLFTTRAAIADRGTSPHDIARHLAMRIRNADRVRQLANNACCWYPLRESMPTGIVMLQSNDPTVRSILPETVREFFAAHSVSVSTYEDGIIRLAMPDWRLSRGEIDLLDWVLQHYRFDTRSMEVSSADTALAEAV